MKKVLDSKLFTFILGLVIATVISVYAINADEVVYHDSDVKSALDSLYTTQNTTVTNLTTANETLTSENESLRNQLNNISIIDNIDFSHNKSVSYGTWATSRTVSVNVTKGDYIIILDGSDAYTTDTKSTTAHANITSVNDLSYTNGTCEVIDGDQTSVGSDTGYGTANTYVTSYNKMVVYKCSFTASTTVSYTHTRPTAYSHVVEMYKLRYIKLD